MKFIYTLLLIVLSAGVGRAQESIENNGEKINAINAEGQRTGIWKIFGEKDGKAIMIAAQFNDGDLVSGIECFMDGKLFARIKNDSVEIYKDDKKVMGTFFKKENGETTIVDESGAGINAEIMKYYTRNTSIQASFYGGADEMYKFINANAKKTKEKGKVNVQFTINAMGYIQDVQVTSSDNPKLNDEAVRLVTMLPRWQPGFQKKFFVKCSYELPVVF